MSNAKPMAAMTTMSQAVNVMRTGGSAVGEEDTRDSNGGGDRFSKRQSSRNVNGRPPFTFREVLLRRRHLNLVRPRPAQPAVLQLLDAAEAVMLLHRRVELRALLHVLQERHQRLRPLLLDQKIDHRHALAV